jgi:hypothetical protein
VVMCAAVKERSLFSSSGRELEKGQRAGLRLTLQEDADGITMN